MATVDGVFRIIDQATAPMRRMERQAQQTDRAIRQLGMTTDGVGSERQVRNLNNLDRGMQTFSRTVENNDRVVRRHTRTINEGTSGWERFKNAITRTGAALRGFGAIMGALKLPAMATAIGVVVQAVGALGGGIIALAPRIADLGGTIFALGPILAGIGGSLATVKLAFNDVGKAIGGNKNALAALTPEARRFVTTLQQYRPVLQELRRSAQQGLFPGLTYSIERLQRAVPVVQTLLGGFGRTLGNLSRQAANQFTQQGFLADLLGIGRAGQRVTMRGGQSILALADAFRHLTVAAIPFTDWLTKMALRAARFIDRWAIFQRDSGRFGDFLTRTRASLTQFAHIIENLYTFFRALGRAARPLGDMLWRDAERATRAWARYADSIQGQISLTRTFTQMRPAIERIVTLFDDLVRAIFRMGSSQGLPGIVSTLDTAVPAVERLLNTFVTTFGPVAADLLVQLTRTLTFLTSATGPLNVFLTLVSRVLGLFNNLIDAVPGLNRVVATAFSVVTIGLFINRLRTVAATWWNIVSGARAATGAQAEALGVGGAAGGGALVVPGAAAARGAATATASGIIIPGARGVRAVTAAGAPIPGSAAAVATGTGIVARGRGLLTSGRGLAGRALGTAGRFAGPVTAALGVFGGLSADRQGGFGAQTMQTLGGIAHGASLGLIPGATTPGQRLDRRTQQLLTTGYTTGGAPGFFSGGAFAGAGGNRFGLLGQAFGFGGGNVPPEVHHRGLQQVLQQEGGTNPRTLAQVEAQVRTYRSFANRIAALGTTTALEAANNLRQQAATMRGVAQNIQRERAYTSRATAYRTIRREGTAFDIYAGRFGLAGATRRTTGDVEQNLNRLPEAGRRILAQQYLAWITEQAKAHPQMRAGAARFADDLVRIYHRLGTNIRIVNGQIIEGTQAQWRSIANVMSSQVERAREAVTNGFTVIQQRALAALQLMGVRPGNAQALVMGIESGRVTSGQAGAVARGDVTAGAALSRHATGGRVDAPGHDMSDRVMAMVGKGELVVNRHTERKIDHLLGGVTTLGQLVAGESRPHSYAHGGRTTDAAATGGGGLGLNVLHPGIRTIAQQVLQAFPALAVTATTNGRHAKNSYHYRGMAVDLGGDPATMMSASTWIGNRMTPALLEGIHNPNLSVKNGRPVGPDFWGARTWGQHLNHIHLAAGSAGALGTFTGGPGGVGRVRFGQLAPPPSGVGGVPGAIADQAGTLMAAGFTRALNRRLAGMGAGGATVAGGGAAGNQQLARQMMLQHGWPQSEWGALSALWTGESGFRANARNASSGAYGIPQALPGSKMASAGPDWMTNPATQIKWGLGYISSRYGSPTSAYQQWLGRHPHWYGDGGNFRARRPMLIGVGDRDEDVSITPRHPRTTASSTGGGAGVQLVVHIDKLEHHRQGDVVEQLHAEFEALATKLETLPIVDDTAVTR
jgi:hypothetical protein